MFAQGWREGGREATPRVWGASLTLNADAAQPREHAQRQRVCCRGFTSDVIKGKSPKGGIAVRNIS